MQVKIVTDIILDYGFKRFQMLRDAAGPARQPIVAVPPLQTVMGAVPHQH